MIESQTYPHIEISISDDCSTDETELEIRKLALSYKYPIIFDRNPKNLGYDRNYRKCIEMASGDYAFVIGNDDSIYGENSIEYLVDFIEKNNYITGLSNDYNNNFENDNPEIITFDEFMKM